MRSEVGNPKDMILKDADNSLLVKAVEDAHGLIDIAVKMR